MDENLSYNLGNENLIVVNEFVGDYQYLNGKKMISCLEHGIHKRNSPVSSPFEVPVRGLGRVSGCFTSHHGYISSGRGFGWLCKATQRHAQWKCTLCVNCYIH